jgi:hypothetical protein
MAISTRMVSASANQFAPPGSSSSQIARTPGLAMFRRHLRKLLESAGESHAQRRDLLIRQLKASPDPELYISEVLAICTSVGSSHRIDTAIDILAQTDDLILRYAQDFLLRDIDRWHCLYSDRAYEPNDDYWFILLRSVALSNTDEGDRLRFILMCSNAASRGVVEGVVESLGEMNPDQAMPLLRDFASDHNDPFIRELAAEVLSDLEA